MGEFSSPTQAEGFEARREKTASIGPSLVQPETDPTTWFLTERELNAACNGVDRDPNLSVFTEENEVTTFTSTDKFFASVYRDIESLPANEGANLWFTGWSTADIPFVPQEDGWENTTFRKVLERAIEKNVYVHGLVWCNVTEKEQNQKMQEQINSYLASNGEIKHRFIFDDRLPHLTSSHHQKSIFLSMRNRSIAYIGGIDLTSERWDTHEHDEAGMEVRKLRGIEVDYKGWVDASVRIVGPATRDVAANFVARWNSETSPLSASSDIFMSDNPPHEERPILEIPRTNASTSIRLGGYNDEDQFSDVSVQVVRTFSPEYENYEFAPRGELSIYHARLKAIQNAKNFIYIEDQYFILVPALRILLLEKLDTIQKLVIVTQQTIPQFSGDAYVRLLFEMIQPLRAKASNKVHVYTIDEKNRIYIHTKVVLVDDVFLTTGSSNWNQRSMTSDSEIAANLVGKELMTTPKDHLKVSKLAFKFRCQKFSEFTRIPVAKYYREWSLAESMQSLDQSASDNAKGDGKGLLRFLDVNYEEGCDINFDELIDPYDVYKLD
uniref:phospholipase D n=1 Tax=Albugo laibachii Nc14 TaxID=890382 RepID=F0WQH7_9STRA|nr:phospholipase D putative [Albugo laibachii Nc14]|eukprot:CCA23586.1 phospholipase D putative [Albugo laibachii Nc14]